MAVAGWMGHGFRPPAVGPPTAAAVSSTSTMTKENTPPDTLPLSGGDEVAWHRRRRTRALGAVLLGLAVIGVLGFFVPAQWVGRIMPGNSIVDDGAVAFRPGSARLVVDGIDVAGTETFASEGRILFMTVSIDRRLSVWEWVEANIDDAIDLHTWESVYGDRTVSENRERNLDLMQSSKDAAVIVALDHLGLDVLEATGVGFEETVADGPVDGVLEPGDVIVAIDDDPVTDLESLRDALGGHAPGDEVVLTVEHHETGDRRRVTVTLGVHPDDGGAFIGISGVQERVSDAPLPFDIEIDSGEIGGPSAGLAFTLSILDLLTPGELTGGGDVAVTGTIRLDGTVGDVGGVAQKAAAARSEGAALFIVPEMAVDEARSTAGSMEVVGVASLDAALEALSDFGGQTTELALPGAAIES
jgi:PDZ domain-containing protein